MLNVALFGPPGAGKGTQAKKIVEKYNLAHLSTGEMIRKEIAEGSDFGKMAAGIETFDPVYVSTPERRREFLCFQ